MSAIGTYEARSSDASVVVSDATDPVRVLCVDYSVGFGGATKSMALMLRDMPGVRPVIVTSQDADLRALWYGAWPTHRFRRVINYRSRWRFNEWLQRSKLPRVVRSVAMKLFAGVDTGVAIASALWIAWLLKRYRIDVLHLANGFTPGEALLAGRLAGVPSIAHLRGFYNASATPRRRSGPLPALVIGDSDAVTDSFLRAAHAVVPATTIYEVVDVASFERSAHRRDEVRRSWGLTDDQVAVGLLGRVIAWKGQEEFVRAMLAAMEGNPDLVGVLVGDASDGAVAYFDRIKELIRSSGKSDRFILTGYVADVDPTYGALDIVVHASTEPEPCGMVVMEGMAARRPVIAADAGGPRELIRHGVDGRLVTPGDVEGLEQAILEVAADPLMRQEMGDAGHERARELFDIPVATGRLRGIYGTLIAARTDNDPSLILQGAGIVLPDAHRFSN